MSEKIINVVPQQLTAENFAVYGDVISVSESAEHFAINDGHTMRYHDLAEVDVTEQQGISFYPVGFSVTDRNDGASPFRQPSIYSHEQSTLCGCRCTIR